MGAPEETTPGPSLTDLARLAIGAVSRRRKTVLRTFAVIFGAFVAYALLAPKTYTSSATVMSQTDSTLSSLSMATAPAGAVSLPAALGVGGSNLDYKLLNILRSRDLAEDVILSTGWLTRFYRHHWNAADGAWDEGFVPDLEKAQRVFRKTVLSVAHDELNQVIVFDVNERDPETSHRIAESVLVQLQRALSEKSASSSTRMRAFLEERLAQIKTELKDAEAKLAEFQVSTQVYMPDAQVREALDLVTTLEAEKTSAEIQKGVLEKYASPGGAKVKAVLDKIDAINAKLKAIRTGEGVDASTRLIPALEQAPELTRRFLELQRQVLVLDKLLGLLTTEYELAKVTELKDDLSFVVIDAPKEPVRKSRPQRLFVLVAGMVTALALAFVAALVREYADRVRAFVLDAAARPRA